MCSCTKPYKTLKNPRLDRRSSNISMCYDNIRALLLQLYSDCNINNKMTKNFFPFSPVPWFYSIILYNKDTNCHQYRTLPLLEGPDH